MPSLGTPPGRLDLRVVAGEALDLTVPILDGSGAVLTTATNPGWTATAQVRTSFDAPTALFTFTTSILAGNVRIQATDEDTVDWQSDWAQFRNPWDLVVTDPNGNGHYLCRGWITLYTTVSR